MEPTDGLDIRFLKEFCGELGPVLAPAMTRALADPPEALKIGETILIPKPGGSVTDPGSYRPITLLPYLTRILAWIIDKRLREEAREKGLLSRCQAGFMPGRSTHEQAFIFRLLQSDAQRRRDPLVAVLLDVAKAFDTLDHATLLRLMREQGFEAQSIEVVRRFLTNSYTKVGEHTVKLERGAPQGSPFSPFVAVIYFQDLARVVAEYVRAHPEGAPAMLRDRLSDEDMVLLALLLFADDTTPLGMTVPWLQGLLRLVSQWAGRVFLKFNPTKSIAALLSRGSSQQGADKLLAGHLKVQNTPIPVLQGEGKLLGVPFRVAGPWVDLDARHPIDIGKATAALIGLSGVFRFRSESAYHAAQYMVDIRTYVRGIRQVVLPGALYAAPVAPLGTADLDVAIRQNARILMGLPCNFPTVLLHWLLRLWPSQFTVDLWTMDFAWRLRHQYWIGTHLALVDQDWHRRHGPFGHITATMTRYALRWGDLAEATYAPPPPEAKATKLPPGLRRWKERTYLVVLHHFFRWVLAKRADAPPGAPWLSFLPQDAEEAMALWTKGFAPFISDHDDYARAGLRMMAPQLGRWAAKVDQTPPCRWCKAAHGERGRHLLQCASLPPGLRGDRQHLLDAVREDMRRVFGRSDPRDGRIYELLYKLDWPGQRPETLDQCLLHMGALIDAYAKTAARDPIPGSPPPWRPYLPPAHLQRRRFDGPSWGRSKSTRRGKWG